MLRSEMLKDLQQYKNRWKWCEFPGTKNAWYILIDGKAYAKYNCSEYQNKLHIRDTFRVLDGKCTELELKYDLLKPLKPVDIKTGKLL